MNFSAWNFRPANWTALETMDESFPQWPALLFDFVLPSRSKHLLLNLWIADAHTDDSQLAYGDDSNGVLNGIALLRLCSQDHGCCNQARLLKNSFVRDSKK